MARVLVVEPDPVIAEVVTACLELDEHQVATASDLPSAVELLQREPVDLVLTDLFSRTFSPDAFTKLAAFTQVAPTTPIVVATAHSRAAAYDVATYGLAAILLKPFRARELRALVEWTLTERRQKLQSLQTHAEQSLEHYHSAEQHIAESQDVLRQVQRPKPPLPPE